MKLKSFLKIVIFGILISCSDENIIFNEYIGPVSEPKKDLSFFIDLIKTKIQFLYLKLINFK